MPKSESKGQNRHIQPVDANGVGRVLMHTPQQHIAGLDIVMDYPLAARIIERGGNGGQDGRGVGRRQAHEAFHHLAQVWPIHQFHGDVGQAAVWLLAHVKNLDDVGVVEIAVRQRRGRNARG